MTAVSKDTFSILIAALGGEGGGVLSNWISSAIREAGYYVQSTSIPGVAQRTGATTYYLEFCLTPVTQLGGRRPVLGLTPTPGKVDVMIASELIEAARSVQNGLVSQDRTTMIASSHRVYATSEKMHMGDGRFDAQSALRTVIDNSAQSSVFDMSAEAEKCGAVINSVLLGALAGSGAVPIDHRLFEKALKTSGKSVEANLRGYRLGREAALNGSPKSESLAPEDVMATERIGRLVDFPAETRVVVQAGYDRCVDYQDGQYADLYLERAQALLAADRLAQGQKTGWTFTTEAARHLALRMTYEDIMRVADLKTRFDRYKQIQKDAVVQGGTPIQVTEFFKPGPEEFCAVLPNWIGHRIMSYIERNALHGRYHLGLHVRSHTISGFLMMRLLARLKVMRRKSWRFAQEETLTRRWLEAAKAALRIDYDMGVEAALCADLVKGYGGTYRRGVRNFNEISERILGPALKSGDCIAELLRQAREAALKGPEGSALDRFLENAELPPPGGGNEQADHRASGFGV